jgi:hypothetical protein
VPSVENGFPISGVDVLCNGAFNGSGSPDFLGGSGVLHLRGAIPTQVACP